VTTFIVLGSLALAGYVAAYAVLVGSVVSSTVSTVTSISQLDRSYTTLSDSLDTWEQATASCDKNLPCVTKQDSNAASAFNTFLRPAGKHTRAGRRRRGQGPAERGRRDGRSGLHSAEQDHH